MSRKFEQVRGCLTNMLAVYSNTPTTPRQPTRLSQSRWLSRGNRGKLFPVRYLHHIPAYRFQLRLLLSMIDNNKRS